MERIRETWHLEFVNILRFYLLYFSGPHISRILLSVISCLISLFRKLINKFMQAVRLIYAGKYRF